MIDGQTSSNALPCIQKDLRVDLNPVSANKILSHSLRSFNAIFLTLVKNPEQPYFRLCRGQTRIAQVYLEEETM
jgi:protein tyrosine phosphatase (PTP) superfamily phosphohydrolase (DUF442 family)